MIYINILYGNSRIGKSTFMNKSNKIEMNNCKYWLFKENEWTDICINYLIENIINNLHKSDMIFTCGMLPLPNHPIYNQLEKEYSIKFIHTLILVKNDDKYKLYIKKRHREHIINKLLEDYKWRNSDKDLYHEIIYN
tara:strand:- start:487 stop:897 length:411 start_codon:yes stop_codon:yes gene_type:complete